MMLGLVTGFIDRLQIVTTCNYSAFASLHTLQFTTAHTRSSQSAMSSPVVPDPNSIPFFPVHIPTS
jgi:hypothetical protein